MQVQIEGQFYEFAGTQITGEQIRELHNQAHPEDPRPADRFLIYRKRRRSTRVQETRLIAADTRTNLQDPALIGFVFENPYREDSP